ncbi:MAG TPA: AMP-binding protein, partial [Acidimicrobiales bacterium]
MIGYEEAIARVTAPGERYELTEVTVGGQTLTAFRHAPPTLRQVFDTARARGDRDFLVYEDERWSFTEVMAHVDALAHLLVEDHGVRRGDRVGIAMRNFPEWIVTFAAVTSIGAVAVALNAWWTSDELDYALGDAEPVVLVADAERTARAWPSCQRRDIAVIVVRAGDAVVPSGAARWEDVLPLGAAHPDVPVGPDDDATILYTSGTTGRPKG